MLSEGRQVFNGHGDVIALTNASGVVTKTYTYNAFGEEEDISTTDGNPFRYCGEYYDTACGTLYLRARNYDASIGRFTQEDPIRDGGNWYSYCAGNPVNAVDPSGCIIQLTGTVEEQQIILSYLQELTDHSLAIAKNGTVYISAFAEDNIKYENGNNLLTRMIDNEHTTTIIIDNNTENQTSYRDIDWAYNKKGVDAVVILNIKNDPDIMTIDSETGNVRPAKRPGYIGLAHEMIHADRLMRGVAIKRNKFSTYRYQIDKVKKYFIFKFWSWMSPVYRVEKVRKEELATIGLKHNKKGDITENMIRKEHGLNLRGAYYLYENN